jgi:hypothetical protein
VLLARHVGSGGPVRGPGYVAIWTRLPRDTPWVRYGWRPYSNLRQALNRNAMRVLAHRRAEVEAILSRHSLRPHSHVEVGVWQVAVYAKDAAEA